MNYTPVTITDYTKNADVIYAGEGTFLKFIQKHQERYTNESLQETFNYLTYNYPKWKELHNCTSGIRSIINSRLMKIWTEE